MSKVLLHVVSKYPPVHIVITTGDDRRLGHMQNEQVVDFAELSCLLWLVIGGKKMARIPNPIPAFFTIYVRNRYFRIITI